MIQPCRRCGQPIGTPEHPTEIYCFALRLRRWLWIFTILLWASCAAAVIYSASVD